MTAEVCYPLGESPAGTLHTPTDVPLEDVSLEAVLDGSVKAHDLRISTETLFMQAEIAERSGFKQLAENLRRAAEMVSMPDSEILRIYSALRPRRSTEAELLQIAAELEEGYGASRVAGFIREAALAYQTRRLTRDDAPPTS